jgi:hypothetical protein
VNIYIDESGDIGSGSRSSDYFVIAAMVVRDPLCVKRCFSRIRRSKLKKKWKKIPEFKFNNTGNILKRRILDCLANCDLDIAYSVLRKRQLYPNLRDKPQIMYNYLTGSLIAKIIGHYRVNDEVVVLVDKSLRGIQRENFDQYVVYKAFEQYSGEGVGNINFVVKHCDSKNEPCIQAADFFAGAVHRGYREGDFSCYELIERRIILEYDYFEGPKK